MSFEFIKKYFPIRTYSLDEFVDTLRREGSRKAEGRSINKRIIKYPKPNTGYRIHHEQYYNLFTAQTATGREVIYEERYGLEYVSGYLGSGRDDERIRDWWRCRITAADRLLKMKENFLLLEISLRYFGDFALGENGIKHLRNEPEEAITTYHAPRGSLVPFEKVF